jgi:hypothetical protein
VRWWSKPASIALWRSLSWPHPVNAMSVMRASPGLFAQRLSDLVAIQLRHADIQKHCIGAESLSHRQSGTPIVDHTHVVSAHFEDHRQTVRGILIVVSHQYPSHNRRGRSRVGCRYCYCIRREYGQLHDKFTTLSQAVALRFHGSAVQFRKPIHEGQADPKAAFGARRGALPVAVLRSVAM